MGKAWPVMLVGNAGTGKSVLMGDKLESLSTDDYLVQAVPFNFYTTSAMLQGERARPRPHTCPPAHHLPSPFPVTSSHCRPGAFMEAPAWCPGQMLQRWPVRSLRVPEMADPPAEIISHQLGVALRLSQIKDPATSSSNGVLKQRLS